MTIHVLRAGPSAVETRYGADPRALGPALAARFVELVPDDATRAFVDGAASRRVGVVKARVSGVLRRFATPFDVNAWLGIHRLFVLGTDAWRTLLGRDGFARLLDVGAGSGAVTATLAPLAAEVVATETSAPAVRKLVRRGYQAHAIDLAAPGADTVLGDARFDLVACLNVLDRAARPRDLLRAVAARVAPGGLALFAIPLPYAPLHFEGGRREVPVEPLLIEGSDWETGVRSIAERILPAVGLEVVRMTRVPYLSDGDARQRLYALDDAVLVAAPRA